MAKKALITGITGQDGAYLANLLLSKGYEVFGTYRRASSTNFWRLDELGITEAVQRVCMELTDDVNIREVIEQVQPDEVYNLAAQSFVGASFKQPIYTGNLDGLSVTRLLSAIHAINAKIRFYQASTSEMFGKVQSIPQTEETAFYPRSPYGVAKLYGHWITINFRESYDMFSCSGILFNHESPLRGEEFVTRKITQAFARLVTGQGGAVELGNLDAKRDWGFAGDYVEGIWLMLQQPEAKDYVMSTGVTHTVRYFAELAAQFLGYELVWKGQGLEETGIDRKTGQVWVKINPNFYRPAEVDLLIGDSSKARAEMNWNPKCKIESLVEMMVKADLRRAQNHSMAAQSAKVA